MRASHSLTGVLAILVGLLIESAQAQYGPYNYGSSENTTESRDSTMNTMLGRETPSTFFPISGASSNGTTPLRLKIRELEKDSTMWNLYILALDMLQYTNESDMLSWYQIAGIHGEPYVPWDNVQAIPGNEQNGYCPHMSIIFPTWHRPYVALFEQVMYNFVQKIAVQYPAGPIQDQFVAAAKNFRVPYWDWAAIPSEGGSVVPDIVQNSPGIAVYGPVGTQTIANPLYTYQFKPHVNPADFIYSPYNQQNYVLRYPTNNTASAVSQDAAMSSKLDADAATFRSRLYILFSTYHNYSTYSNTAWYPDNTDGDYDSIEGIHDQIHAMVGMGGHMSVTDYAAFDPLFMLHHANIDRLFAMWQVLNPNSYVVPTLSAINTFTIAQGQMLDSTTDLAPFHDPSGTFWNSDSVRDIATFAYTYPETNSGAGINVTDQVLKAVNNLYGDQTTNGTDGGITARDVVTTHREWIVNLKVNKHALNGTFFVYIFLGPFSANPSDWSFDPNLVGTYAVLDKFDTRNLPDKAVTGTVPLTGTLSKLTLANKLQSLDPDDVEPYLTANLKYTVGLLDNTQVSNADVPSLTVAVISAPVTLAQNDSELPTWGQTVMHMEIQTTA